MVNRVEANRLAVFDHGQANGLLAQSSGRLQRDGG